MKYRSSTLVTVKEIVKKILKSSSIGKVVYPAIQGAYRLYAVPMKRKRLSRYGSEALRRIETVLRKYDIRHYMDYGTLLGIVRDNGFIKHDDDIDITIMPGATTPGDLLKKLIDSGYGFIHAFDYNGELIEFTVADESQITIDFFFPKINVDDNKIYDFTLPDWSPDHNYPSENANDVIVTPYLGAEDVMDYVVMNVHVTIPTNAEQVLESEYGPWRVPDPNFRCQDDVRVIHFPGYAYRLTKEEALAHK